MDRVIAITAPCTDHFTHLLHLVEHRDGCDYYECSRGCGTRKVIVGGYRGGMPDTSWLRTGRFRVDEAILGMSAEVRLCPLCTQGGTR